MDKIRGVIDWCKRNKTLIGIALTICFGIAQQHAADPAFDVFREALGWISGLLIGSGAFNSDDIARFKQGKLSNIAMTLGPASVPVQDGQALAQSSQPIIVPPANITPPEQGQK